ncbi:MAG: nitroreductase family protein [Bacteroidales bacterium]|jgi:nitroreductase|nr:nitroreductase family protein [Bacteroidales bacterium]
MYQNIREQIAAHRSIRQYLPDPVAEDTLREILEAGTCASNTGNMQVYSMVVTRDESLRKQLWEVHFRQNMVLQAPVLITFCADVHRFSRWCEARNTQPAYHNLLWFCNASTDAVLASQNVALAAESFGLGVCYLGTAVYNAGRIIDILQLPEGVIPVTAMVMGYPDEQPPLTGRLPAEAVIHAETYHEYSNEQLDCLYAGLEAGEQTKKLLEINKKETLAQVFVERRYTRKDNEAASESYLKAMQRQNFI